jgi:hypothetical protein
MTLKNRLVTSLASATAVFADLWNSFAVVSTVRVLPNFSTT